MSDEDDLVRKRVLVALAALSPQVQGDVLADGTIQSQFRLSATRPMRLNDKVVVPQEDLFAAFTRAATGTPTSVSLRYEDAPLDCKVWIEPDATAVLEVPKQRFRFAFAALLVAERERRLEFLATILAAHTLTKSTATEVRRMVELDSFTHDDFLTVCEWLNTAPEVFARGLTEHLAKRKDVGESDLLPEDPRHWDNLTATPERSQTLPQFIDDELAAERRARVAADVGCGFSSMALTFGAPELVPREWIRGLDVETVVRGVSELATAEDHFSLAGAFEICADCVAKDARFVALGEQLLDRLFADTDALLRRCQTFAAAFVLATARLAMHATTRTRPVYWRRLAAVAHAGLVVRACGASPMEREGLLRWALRLRGLEYKVSVYLDVSVEPQWRPEWLDPGILAADVFGRVNAATRLLPAGAAPTSWVERLATANRWIEGRHLVFQSQFAAILQGACRTEHPVPDEDLLRRVEQDYLRLEEHPSAEHLVALTPWIETLALPGTADVGVRKLLDLVRKGSEPSEPDMIQAALSLAAHLAVLSADVSLADAVADTYLERVRMLTGELPVLDAVFRLVECAAADSDRMRARDVLAKRLERMSFSLPTGASSVELVAALQVIQSLDGELSALLGRAVQAARLAAGALPVQGGKQERMRAG